MNPFQKLSKDAPEKLKQIEKWSAGCQEFAIRVHIEEAMTILEKFKASTAINLTIPLIRVIPPSMKRFLRKGILRDPSGVAFRNANTGVPHIQGQYFNLMRTVISGLLFSYSRSKSRKTVVQEDK